MIPILQFDPASLSIWYDTHLINRMRGNTEIGKAIDYALRSDLAAIMTHVDQIEDDWTKVRSATVAAAVWHEKRHFLDFTLTNYGAFRLRQFFMVYGNIPAVLEFARDSGELLVPLDGYLGRAHCRELGVKPPSDEILTLARDIKDRQRMLLDDCRPVRSRFGEREIGGEAILEALAHHFEAVSAQLLFGTEMSRRIRADVPDKQLVAARYQWLYEILIASGLIDLRPNDHGFNEMNAAVLVPICYAALACRLWKQKQVESEGVSSYLPGYRLASLVPALLPHREALRSGSIIDAWDIVNAACGELFGRTCIEEIESDIECEARFIETLQVRDPASLEVRAYADFHALRQRFLGVLKDDPAQILADFEYTAEFSGKLQPFVVVAASAGEFGDPPPDYDRLLGFADPEALDDEYSRWWWAALAQNWPQHERPEVFCLRDRQAWIDIISDAAPFAKLLISGRKVRIMLGPELMSAEMRVKAQCSAKIRVDPHFAFPRHAITAANWYYLTGRDSYRCDLTWETVQQPEGVVIDPWTLRLWPTLVRHLLGRIADKNALTRMVQRDWSPWLLSEEFRELFEEAAEDSSLFVALNWTD